jgi:uncharacterized protein YbbK (DUF523 family)
MPAPEYIASACLAGELCRWDGTSRPNPEVVEMVKSGRAVALCPEVLGNLGVPRLKAEIRGGDGDDVISGEAKVINEENQDVTEAFLMGAKIFLRQAQKLGIKKALMKENSPSCGVKAIYNNEKLVGGCGVTTALLLNDGIEIEAIQ